MTLRSLIAEGEAALRLGPHADRSRIDAERLLQSLLHRNRAWLIANPEAQVPAGEQKKFRSLILRRAAGEPMQYITGWAEFFGLPFHVEPGVLIPRPETEHLVEEVLRLAAPLASPRIADIGTGSGAIAVALSHARPEASITATDLSAQALKIARANAEQNGVSQRIAFVKGDLLAPLRDQRFDIIASNPPYIPLGDRESIAVEVREHEPASALFAGDDGLDIYRRLIPDAARHLAYNGWLALEIGYGQALSIEELLLVHSYTKIHLLPDYQGIPRVAVGRFCGS